MAKAKKEVKKNPLILSLKSDIKALSRVGGRVRKAIYLKMLEKLEELEKKC